jgi:hypothetical protein
MVTGDAKTRMARATDLAGELFDLANSFAGDETGDVAVLLHCACNDIHRARMQLEGTLPQAKKVAVIAAEQVHNMW